MTSEQFVTCWENRHTGETGHGNPTTIEMATAVAAFGDILYPHREHFVEDVELDGSCVNQSKVFKEKCSTATATGREYI